MGVDRIERVNSLLKRVVGEAMFRVFQGEDVAPGTITVTGVNCAKDLRNATIRVSIFGDEEAHRHVIKRLARKTQEFARIINREVRLKFTPQIRFVVDRSLERGDHVLALLDALPAAADASPAAEADTGVPCNGES